MKHGWVEKEGETKEDLEVVKNDRNLPSEKRKKKKKRAWVRVERNRIYLVGPRLQKQGLFIMFVFCKTRLP